MPDPSPARLPRQPHARPDLRFPGPTGKCEPGRCSRSVVGPLGNARATVCESIPSRVDQVSQQSTLEGATHPMQSSRIFIVGSGVVGSATGEGFLAAGHRVTFIDISLPRVEELKARGLDARTELDLSDEPDSFVFLTLPTPNDGRRYDL